MVVNILVELFQIGLCCHIYHSLGLLQRNHLKTSIGTEELGHLEMIGTLVYQLTKNLSQEEIRRCGFDAYFVDHTTGVYPSSAAGVPFTAAYLQSKGDIITDLHEDMAADATTA